MEINVDGVVEMLIGFKNVIIILGYGLVVVKVQYVIVDMVKEFKERGFNVCFGIYFVVGCMLG